MWLLNQRDIYLLASNMCFVWFELILALQLNFIGVTVESERSYIHLLASII